MKSDVMAAQIGGEAVEISDQDDPNNFEKQFFKHGYSKSKAATESAAAGNRYKTIENYQALVRDYKIKLYQWLFKHTKNEAKDVGVQSS